MNKQEARDDFLAILVGELPDCPAHEVLALAKELTRLARRHGKIAERECNGHQTPSGSWNEAAAKRDAKASERIEARITALCQPLGITPVFSGDPRGATVKLKVPSGRFNDWGGTGICVPQ